MAVTQIVGPRIKPYWAEPAEWTSTRAYESFTFVTYQGDSYCSRQDTPIGIDITNSAYWVKVSDYNAQAVALQRTMTNTIEAAESSMESTIQTAENDMTSTINAADASINQKIADANANMTAQVAAVESVKNEFQTQLDQVTTNKNNIATLQEPEEFIVIGDSFSDQRFMVSGGILWCKRLADWLGLKLHNYAEAGAGYRATGIYEHTTFVSQVNTAINDSSVIKNNVTRIVILGGLNDVRQQTYTYTNPTDFFNNYVSPLVATLRSNFPHATVYVGFDTNNTMEMYNSGGPRIWEYFMFRQNVTNANDANCMFVPLFLTPLWWYQDSLFVDNVAGHPNQRGHNLLANLMLSYFTGSGWIQQIGDRFNKYLDNTEDYKKFIDGIYLSESPWQEYTEVTNSLSSMASNISTYVAVSYSLGKYILTGNIAFRATLNDETLIQIRLLDGFITAMTDAVVTVDGISVGKTYQTQVTDHTSIGHIISFHPKNVDTSVNANHQITFRIEE